mmetsp:Transcript_25887/g.35618  ORF Transcript_25887/g.35618 Transcript_25887/m.35618 type:complete len:259 (+) Transcript_25887:1669-2445(+)
MTDYTVLYLIFSEQKIGLWSFLSLKDVLNLSISSRFGASLMIPPYATQAITRLSDHPHLQNLGRFNIKFQSDLSIGMLRRVLNRLCTGSEAVVSVDSTTGRIVLDIGSAFNKDVYLASQVTAFPLDEEFTESEQIQKHLEVCSYDEYDDFQPRHPLPKEKNHRRGDSYFNSDVDMYANEAVVGMKAFDMQNIAAAATALNVEEVDANAIKNKFLSRKKSTLAAFEHTHVTTNKFPGKTKSFHERVTAQVTSTESDEER